MWLRPRFAARVSEGRPACWALLTKSPPSRWHSSAADVCQKQAARARCGSVRGSSKQTRLCPKDIRKNRGLEREELLPLACSAIRHLSSVLKSSGGHRPEPSTIAVAIARLAGCGQSSTAVARQIDPALNQTGSWIDIDRIASRSSRWQAPIEAALMATLRLPRPRSRIPTRRAASQRWLS